MSSMKPRMGSSVRACTGSTLPSTPPDLPRRSHGHRAVRLALGPLLFRLPNVMILLEISQCTRQGTGCALAFYALGRRSPAELRQWRFLANAPSFVEYHASVARLIA